MWGKRNNTTRPTMDQKKKTNTNKKIRKRIRQICCWNSWKMTHTRFRKNAEGRPARVTITWTNLRPLYSIFFSFLIGTLNYTVHSHSMPFYSILTSPHQSVISSLRRRRWNCVSSSFHFIAGRFYTRFSCCCCCCCWGCWFCKP